MGNNLTVEQVNHEMQLVQAELARETKKFSAVLPKHIPVERFQRVVVTALMNNTDLLLVPPDMFLRECLKAAQDGLLPDGKLGALVPRGNAKKGNITVTWQPMIAGIRQKARNSGQISVWDAHCVYANDPFHVRLGADPNIEHTIDFTKDDRGPMVAAYSIAIMKDGTKSFEVMTKKQIEEIRDRSDAYKAFKAGFIKSTPWHTDFDEMSRKTVAKRHAKQLPMSSDLDDLLRRDDDLYSFGAGAQDIGDVTAGSNGRPKNLSLSSRLDEIGEEGDRREGAEDAEVDSSQAEADEGGQEDEAAAAARKAGVSDKRAGKPKRQMPAKYRNDEKLSEAYIAGHDSAEVDETSN